MLVSPQRGRKSLDDRIQRAAENPLGWSSSRRMRRVSDARSERSSFHATLKVLLLLKWSCNVTPPPRRRPPTGWAQTASATVLSGGSTKRHAPSPPSRWIFIQDCRLCYQGQTGSTPTSQQSHLPPGGGGGGGGGTGGGDRGGSQKTLNLLWFLSASVFFFSFFPSHSHSPRAETSSKGGAGGRTLYLLYNCLRRRWEPT